MSKEIKPHYYNGVPQCGCGDCPYFSERTKRDGTRYKRGGGWCELDPIGSVMRWDSNCYPAARADRDELITLRAENKRLKSEKEVSHG